MTRRYARGGQRGLEKAAGRASTDPRRALALLLAAMFVCAGCGSATVQATQPSTSARPSTSTIPTSQATGSKPTQSADGGPSGIAGQTVAVVCGGASPDEQTCPRHPVRATIDVLRLPSQRRIATVRSDNGGHFGADLPPGAYELRAHISGYLAWARTVTTRVPPHQIKRTTVTFVPRHPLPVAPGFASG